CCRSCRHRPTRPGGRNPSDAKGMRAAMLLPWVIGFRVPGSVGAVAGAAAMLLFPEAVRRRIVPSLVSYATGTLLGAAFLGMLPAALEQAPARGVMATVLAGVLAFFVLEKLVLWRHFHDDGT